MPMHMPKRSLFNELLYAPMVEWRERIDRAPARDRLDAEAQALDLAVRAARISAYLGTLAELGRDARHPTDDFDHARAVTRQNAVAARVRKGLGFTIPRDDISF